MCVPLSSLGMMIAVFYSGIDFEKYFLAKAVMTFFFVCMLVGNMLFFFCIPEICGKSEWDTYTAAAADS